MTVRWLDSNWTLVGAYVAAAATCVVIGFRERAARPRPDAAWPTFWFVTGALLAAMAFGRADRLGALVSNAERARAQAGGWYAGRHHVQVLALDALGVAWLLVVGVAIWRAGALRRRCLPVAVVMFSLLSFIAVRLVSLHRVDRILGHRIHGVRAGSLVELAGTGLVVVLSIGTAVWSGVVGPALRSRRAGG